MMTKGTDWMAHIMSQLEHSKKLHSVSFWTGLVGGIVLLLNQNFGTHLDNVSIVAIAGIVATLILGGHYSAGKIADAVANVAEAMHYGNAQVVTAQVEAAAAPAPTATK